MNYKEEKKYIGHRDQLFRINHVKMQDGKAKDVNMLQIDNRSGLHFEINEDRGMDIPYLSFKGTNVGFISPCGVVSPEYYDDNGLGFLKSFTAGFMTTGGLQYAGAPCEYEGTAYGLHGHISHTPATNVSFDIDESESFPKLVISGRVEDAQIFGDKLTLQRKIVTEYEKKELSITDTVTNEGYRKARHFILYHCNIGYPLLSPESKIYIPTMHTEPRNEHAKQGMSHCMKLETPDPNYEEMCYYQTLKPDRNHMTSVAVFNPELDFGIAISFDLRTLDHFVEWKMMGARDYVMGLEPCNSTIDGIEDAIERGTIKYLEPGQSVTYHLTMSIIDGKKEFEKIKK